MEDVRRLCVDGTVLTPSTRNNLDQDTLYTRVAVEFGMPLARLAAAYELDPTRRQDLLQELHFSLWRSLATFADQCSLRTWVYRVAHSPQSVHRKNLPLEMLLVESYRPINTHLQHLWIGISSFAFLLSQHI